MTRVDLAIKAKSEVEKMAWWRGIIQDRLELMHVLADAGATEVADLIKIEVDGGECPKCGVPWKRVEFDNPYGAGQYHTPACHCWTRCPRCMTELYEETASGVLYAHKWICPNCGFRLFVGEERRWGQEYEARWQGMSRRERHKEAMRE